MKKSLKQIYRFQIALHGIEPPIWRRIEVPASYSFWDLHVAIQDAMGWLDCHLHLFHFEPTLKGKGPRIGIPDDDFGMEVEAGWDTPITRYFNQPGQSADYEYDFGDGWLHGILLEGMLLAEPGVKYPRCLAGGRACPPEDCGGVGGYFELLQTLADSKSAEHQDMVEWLKGHLKNYHPLDPDSFDPQAVVFDNPKKRFKMAFPSR